jgi:hypothetical protein
MSLVPLIRDGFALSLSYTNDLLSIVFSGCADNEAQPLLGRYFEGVHAEVLRTKQTEVIVDVHELYFINSNCFKALVTWVSTVTTEDPTSRYWIRFVKDPSLRWQTRSFDAFHRMSLALVTIEDWAGGNK